MRSPAVLQHTGTGRFTITNYKEGRDYAVFTTGGAPVAGTSVTNGVVSMGTNYGGFRVSLANAPSKGTTFARKAVTYTNKSTTSCSDKCGVVNGGNCYEGTGSCWCGSCAADGTICCGGCYGQDCTTSTTQVKDSVPSGYTERYGEWVQIMNPETATVEEKETGLFTLGDVEWDDKYYQVVDMPAPYEASEFDAEGVPTGNTIPNRPAWDYTSVYFIFYNEDGSIGWTRDHISEPECFELREIENMKTYQMVVRNLPASTAGGTYEFVIANDTEDFVRVEGIV